MIRLIRRRPRHCDDAAAADRDPGAGGTTKLEAIMNMQTSRRALLGSAAGVALGGATAVPAAAGARASDPFLAVYATWKTAQSAYHEADGIRDSIDSDNPDVDWVGGPREAEIKFRVDHAHPAFPSHYFAQMTFVSLADLEKFNELVMWQASLTPSNRTPVECRERVRITKRGVASRLKWWRGRMTARETTYETSGLAAAEAESDRLRDLRNCTLWGFDVPP